MSTEYGKFTKEQWQRRERPVPLPCPKCDHTIPVSQRDLRSTRKIPVLMVDCPSCGTASDAREALHEAVKKIAAGMGIKTE